MKAGTMFALAAVMLLSARVHGEDTTPAAEGSAPAEAAAPTESTESTESAAPADTGAESAEAAAEPPLPTVPVDAAAAEALPESVQLDEVVVTAQRREQRVVEVPINLSTVDRDDIQK